MKTQTNNVTRLAGLYLAAITAAVALLAALATSAGAAPPGIDGFRMAKFKVEIEGTSNTTWHSTREAPTDCDTADHSFGSERFSFATRKPVVITATYFPDELNPDIFAGGSALGAQVEAKVRRSYTPSVTPPARTCEDNGGGAEPVRYDCGFRRLRDWHVEVEFSDKKRNGLQLHGDHNYMSPYENCPTSAPFTFPEFLDVKGAHTVQPLYADLSPADIFNPKLEKWITIGDGTYEERDSLLSSRTHVHWTVSFTRLKA